MSHFTVTVVTRTPEKGELEEALQPFHEYECTGVLDEHVVFVDEHDETVSEWEGTEEGHVLPDGRVVPSFDDALYRDPTAAEAKVAGPMMGTGFSDGVSYSSRDWGDGLGYRPKVHDPDRFETVEAPTKTFWPDFEAYAKDYHGREILDGRAGRWTNPNSKWDWWVVGGRWSNRLLLTDGTRADHAPRKRIDFEGAYGLHFPDAVATKERARAIVGEFDWRPWREVLGAHHGNIDEARDEYHSQRGVALLREDEEFRRVWGGFDDLLSPDYARDAATSNVATFAVLKDGVWHARAEMGWWAVEHDPDDTYDFARLMDSVDPEHHCWVVDCHV